MKASNAAGLFTFVVVLLGGLIGLWADKYLGLGICGAALVWYARRGAYLRGYLMQESEQSMRQELDSITALSERWLHPDGSVVAEDDRSKLQLRRRSLLRMLGEIEEESTRKW